MNFAAVLVPRPEHLAAMKVLAARRPRRDTAAGWPPFEL